TYSCRCYTPTNREKLSEAIYVEGGINRNEIIVSVDLEPMAGKVKQLYASPLRESLNFSHFVARKIWRKRGVSPRRYRAHRRQRREPLRGLLVPMATTGDLLQTVRNCAKFECR